jgi:hypothetical protein
VEIAIFHLVLYDWRGKEMREKALLFWWWFYQIKKCDIFLQILRFLLAKCRETPIFNAPSCTAAH